MPLRTIASLAIAVFLGLIAVVLVRGVLSSQRGAPVPAGAMAPVVVASLPLEHGVVLKPEMVKVVSYPKDAVPVGAFQSLDQLFGKNLPARTVERPLALNEPVLNSKLNGPGSKTTLSAAIAPGMRAVSVRSSDVAGVAGFVLPGDRVDILMTRSIGSGDTATSVTQVLAENTLVLGVDQTSDQETDKPVVAKAVTVQVTPEQAQVISLAESVGQISLSLRQIADNGPLGKKATSVADLSPVGVRPAPGKVKAKRAGPSSVVQVRVVRGVEATPYSVGF
jgi:pilus assembly protein CpaB